MSRTWNTAQDAPQHMLDQLVALHEAGENAVVADLAGQLLTAFPASHVLWQIYGGVLLALGRHPEAEQALRQAAVLAPALAQAQVNHSVALRACARFAEAEAAARRGLELAPDDVKVMAELCAVLNYRGKAGEALKLADVALRLDPTAVVACHARGVALQAMGRAGEARKTFERAVEIAPSFAKAHRNLASRKAWEAPDAQLEQMEALRADPDTPPAERMLLCFGLFTAWDKLGDTAQAWRYLSEGNALRKAQLGYDIAEDERRFDRIRAAFGGLVPLRDVTPAPVVPVFILGMPRSGTTLVEQIVSAHRQVTGGGELETMGLLAGDMMEQGRTPDADMLRAVRAAYLRDVEPLARERPFVTDKMPHNFRCLGLIAAALPEARIVQVVRDPAAVCWSNLRQYFVAQGLGYAHDPADVVRYHGLYTDLMADWHVAWPGRIRVLDYEALTADPERETRALIADLDLPWDDACLRPEANARAVQTASLAQVRRKVYRGSSAAWRRYEACLGSAFDSLARQGEA